MPELAHAAPASHAVPQISLRRRVTDHVMTTMAVATVGLVLAPLIAIFAYLVYRGIGSINWAFLTQTPKPVGEAGGGMANAIVGSGLILGIASLIGVPFGVGAGIYLAELGRNRFGDVVRFTADVLNGVPSIVIGIVGWAIMVRGRGFSAVAGGVALAIMMVPTITRTTEEMLLLVPQALREAAYGLGVPRWRTTPGQTAEAGRGTASPGRPARCSSRERRSCGKNEYACGRGRPKSTDGLRFRQKSARTAGGRQRLCRSA